MTSKPSEPAPASRPMNRLAREKSPYLLQHRSNPVDWYPWGEEAFAKARREGKPIFLSVGYSTCHWCHVMERESFEDERIAALLNESFVSVKVDREERPDVDRVYMAYVQALTGGGGWPMSVWLTPDLQPFYGGTYFPPTSKYGRPGFPDILNGLARAWRERREELMRSADAAMGLLRQETSAAPAGDAPNATALEHAADVFERAFDERYGGFGGAPKFPRPSVLLFLLREHVRTGNAKPLEMATKTLAAMAKGGMNDQLGGGFHRYSVDGRWHVPHFEKMLYDQGQLAVAYAEAALIAHDALFARTLAATCDYVLRDMTSPEGGFYSAEDADSAEDAAHPEEKREGAFYVFTREDIDRATGDAAEAFSLRYGVETDGNAEDPHGELTGKNVLFVAREIDDVAKRLGAEPAAVARKIDDARAKLLALRAKRPRPHLDDKVLVGWNGLMISGLALAARALDEPRYLAAAERAADFVAKRMRDPKTGKLSRRYRDGDIGLAAHADDYAFFVQGLLDLYETGLDPARLELAEALHRKQDELFRDAGGRYFSSAGDDPSILVRMQE
ncbi:MAG TPA: thioredoxin domain-containing protein, partial [Planctomycetota bacterium]|nr:thioredoxin domain-containing protein [Planctomycetota bacterium]